jgi:hypothetical protein
MLGHAHEVVSVITPPLALLLLDELGVRRRMGTLALALLIAGLGIMQFFLAEEGFVTELIAAAVIVVILGLMYREQVRPALHYMWRVLRIAAPVVAVVIAVPAGVQFFGPNAVSGPAIHAPDIFLSDPLNLILPTSLQWISPDPLQQLTNHFTGNVAEWDGYVGMPLLLILLVALRVWWRVPVARVAGLTAIVITVLSFGPHLHVLGRASRIPLPWWIAAHTPVLKNVQPNRLTIFVYLAIGLALAFILWRLAQAGRRAIAGAVAVVAVVPLMPKLPLAMTPLVQPAFFTSNDVTVIPSGAVVLTAPWAEGEQPEGYAWQFASGLRYRQVGGYIIGAVSPSSTELHTVLNSIETTHALPSLSASERQRFLDELRRTDVSVVLAGPSGNQPVYAEFFTDILGAQPQVRSGVDLWFLTPSQ